MNKTALLAFLSLFLLPIASAIDVCGNYTTSTTLSNDLTSAGTCVTLNTSNVIFNCNGHSVTAVDRAFEVLAANVTITNCNVPASSVGIEYDPYTHAWQDWLNVTNTHLTGGSDFSQGAGYYGLQTTNIGHLELHNDSIYGGIGMVGANVTNFTLDHSYVTTNYTGDTACEHAAVCWTDAFPNKQGTNVTYWNVTDSILNSSGTGIYIGSKNFCAVPIHVGQVRVQNTTFTTTQFDTGSSIKIICSNGAGKLDINASTLNATAGRYGVYVTEAALNVTANHSIFDGSSSGELFLPLDSAFLYNTTWSSLDGDGGQTLNSTMVLDVQVQRDGNPVILAQVDLTDSQANTYSKETDGAGHAVFQLPSYIVTDGAGVGFDPYNIIVSVNGNPEWNSVDNGTLGQSAGDFIPWKHASVPYDTFSNRYLITLADTPSPAGQVNTSEGIGESVLTSIKGGAQLVAGVVDTLLDPNIGFMEVGALVLVGTLSIYGFLYIIAI